MKAITLNKFKNGKPDGRLILIASSNKDALAKAKFWMPEKKWSFTAQLTGAGK